MQTKKTGLIEKCPGNNSALGGEFTPCTVAGWNPLAIPLFSGIIICGAGPRRGRFLSSVSGVVMSVEYTSRKASEQMFTLYARSLHPELFNIHVEREIFRDFYTATFWIIGSSHVVSFGAGDTILTEVVADAGRDLPVQHKISAFSFAHNPQKRFRYDDGVAYDAHFDYERYDREGFLAKLQEIKHAVVANGVYHVFDVEGEHELSTVTAVGFVPRARSLNVRTFHTFPEELAVIETHSRWEVRRFE